MKKGLSFAAASALAISAIAVVAPTADAAATVAKPGFYDGTDNKYYSVTNFQKLTTAQKAALLIKPNVFLFTGTHVVTAENAVNAKTNAELVLTPVAQFTAIDLDAIYNDETPIGDLKVESVSAINATQIEIVFNQKVDERTAENLDNYYIGLTKDVDSKFVTDLGNTGYSAELLEDGKTVVISADNVDTHAIWEDEYTTGNAVIKTDAGNILKNRTVYVQIKDIKTADGKLASAVEDSFVAKDSDGPKFASSSYSVEKVDENPVIIFNEPVVYDVDASGDVSLGDTQFYLNGTNVTAAVSYATSLTTPAGKSAIKVDLATVAADFELEEGNNTFEVVGLEDFAGNSTTPNRITTTIKVAENAVEAPKVTGVEQVHDGAFRVIFDKAIATATGTATIKNNKNDGDDWVVLLNATGVGTSGADGFAPVDSTYTGKGFAYLVEFDEDVDYTTDEVYNDANSVIRTVVVENFKDTTSTKTGNKYSKAHTFKKDNVAPTLEAAKTNTAQDDIVFTFEDAPFNGDVQVGSATDDVILKLVESGITHTVAVDPASFVPGTNPNEFVLGLDPATNTEQAVLFANGKLKAGIVAVLPHALVTDNEADATPQYEGPFEFIGATVNVVGGSSAVVPQTSQAGTSYNSALKAIELKFVGEDINAATVTNLANYTFDGKALPSGARIEFDANKVARIYLPTNSVVRDGNYSLTIKDVATNSGAKMLQTTVTVYDVKDNTQPLATAAKVTSDNTIEVTFDETLAALGTNPQRNFKVIVGGATYNVSGVVAKNSRTLVLTTVDTFDYNKAVKVEFAPDASGDVFVEDIAGNKAGKTTVTATKDIQ